MDDQTFDRLTHLFAAPRSRRAAWRALVATALFGVTTRRAAAMPLAKKGTCDATRCPKTPQGEAGFCCHGNQQCSCNGECCPGKTGCFVSTDGTDELCCTRPDRIICGNQCCKNVGKDSCIQCLSPHPSGIAGSYRRR